MAEDSDTRSGAADSGERMDRRTKRDRRQGERRRRSEPVAVDRRSGTERRKGPRRAKRSINQYKDAVAGMIGQEEKKKAKLKSLTDEIQQLERLKAGAAAMAKKLVAKHNSDVEAVKADPEYARCQEAFQDFSEIASPIPGPDGPPVEARRTFHQGVGAFGIPAHGAVRQGEDALPAFQNDVHGGRHLGPEGPPFR